VDSIIEKPQKHRPKPAFVISKLENDVEDEVEHMFVNENALRISDEPVAPQKKKTMWSQVYEIVNQWPKHKAMHSQ
jgi:hypothetical protein